MIRDQAQFTWLDPAYLDNEGKQTVERTTSQLEGGINAAINRLLRDHTGLPEDHARTAVDWLLNSFTEHPYEPWALAQRHLAHRDTTPARVDPEDPIGPVTYDTQLTAEEDLWTRKGWAGRP